MPLYPGAECYISWKRETGEFIKRSLQAAQEKIYSFVSYLWDDLDYLSETLMVLE